MRDKNIEKIQNLLNNQKIIKTKLISSSFGINCLKIKTSSEKNFIVKLYKNKKNKFNSIKAEAKNLIFLNKKKINIFPKLINHDDAILIMEYIENNEIKPKRINKHFLKTITTIHKVQSDKYGFSFDTQIGGMQQKNKYEKNWMNFFRENRLYNIYNKICKTKPMPKQINKKIEILLKNLNNRIPAKPKSSLLHGDLWDGNILFKNKKLVGLIDPGSFFGHSEMEVAYLTWFNPHYIGSNFVNNYSKFISIDKNYSSYEPIYQLYYSLMNVHLWDRIYIKDVNRLINKIKP